MKTIFLFLLISGCLHSLYGQDPEPGKYLSRRDSMKVKKYSAMGIHAGFNNSLNKGSGSDFLYDPGFMFDVYEVFDIGDKWQIEGGLGGIEFGGKNLQYGNKNQRHDTLFYFNFTFTGVFYITVPLTVKYKYSEKSTFLAGVRLSSMINPYGTSVDAYAVNGQKYEYPQVPTIFDFPPFSNKNDIGPVLGYEYHFNKRFSLSAILNIGLVPIFTRPYIDQNGTVYAIGPGDYNNSINIGISYDFLKN